MGIDLTQKAIVAVLGELTKLFIKILDKLEWVERRLGILEARPGDN